MSQPTPTASIDGQPVAVLVSGGLDSAILLAEMTTRHAVVHPLYVRHGLSWETVELSYLRRFVELIKCPTLQPLQVLAMPVADLYAGHWSMTGRDVPDAQTPDEAVYLPGRNVLMLAKAMIWCVLHGAGAVALGSLQTNPFPDATPAFFAGFQAIVNQAINARVEVQRPYGGMTKKAVMERGRDLPLEWTFSCIHPIRELHCGLCNKCAERRHAFEAAGMADPTRYFHDGK
jgi:7-cyano-7-deazaguanine synthase